ncbi:hypothetical protein RIF29_40715 [Crotalaria pallida]|uniref:Senescence regulator S40 n=1 Tax=Crotalaria pallida TaxID=3830 RepID=A0AAN9E607_CROPI
MADQGAFLSKRSSSGFGGGSSAMKGRGFDEEDGSKGGSSSSAWYKANASKKIPRANNNNAKVVQGSSSFSSSSGPMDIPDWSKIYGKNYCNKGSSRDGDDDDDDDGDDDDDDMIPPHEWLARKLARNQISSFSVCEGVGRTLKGRDLSKVRNAILTKTGFIE